MYAGASRGYIQPMTYALPAQTSRWNVARAPGGWTLVDAALALVFLIATVEEILVTTDMRPRGPLLAGAVLVALPLAWRRTFPAVVALVSSAGNLLIGLTSTGPFVPQLAFIPVLVALYSAGFRLRGRTSAATGAITLAMFVVAHVASVEGHVDDFWPYLLWGGAWFAGTFVRRRADLAAHHAARAALLEVQAETTAADSAQRERDRIARELHDVVAHSVSVMVVQAGAERLRLGDASGPTAEALDAIEQAGRLALSELRSMLGVLRDGAPDEGTMTPLPGLSAVPSLVNRLRSAGLPVELEMSGVSGQQPGGSTTGLELAAYRILQESLTNVVRHAGLVPTYVRLTRSDAALELFVRNEAPRSRPDDPSIGSGQGLVGMRERALAVGGSFESGPDPDGGFRVHSVLPVAVVRETQS